MTGENTTFHRSIGEFWDEAALYDYSWEGKHFADKGGGEYNVKIIPETSKVYTDEGVCYLNPGLENWIYVAY